MVSRIRHLVLGTLLFCLAFPCFSQTVDYNDVAVIVNTNSVNSQIIGSYFQNARNIPAANMIFVTADTVELIDTIAFSLIQGQVEAHLLANGIQDSINYLVTTKGLPFLVDHGNCSSPQVIPLFQICATVETQLAFSLSGSAPQSGSGQFSNPFFDSQQHHTRGNSGIYLTTRLDAYTVTDVLALIDRSGPDQLVSTFHGNVVVDLSNQLTLLSPVQLPGIYNFMANVRDEIQLLGWNTVLDTFPTVLPPIDSVVALFSADWDTTDNFVDPAHQWSTGSIVFDAGFSGGFSFDPSLSPNSSTRAGRFIQSGATGVFLRSRLGLLSTSFQIPTGIANYLDLQDPFNLAESFWSVNDHVGNQVMVGDPKTSILLDNTLSVDGIENIGQAVFYPNPSSNTFTYSSTDLEHVQILDGTGRVIIQSQDAAIDLSPFDSGMYTAIVFQDGKRQAHRLVKVN